MKNFCLAAVIAIFLLVCSIGIQAQTTKTQINQLELMKRFIGTWQTNIGKDTIEIWDCQS